MTKSRNLDFELFRKHLNKMIVLTLTLTACASKNTNYVDISELHYITSEAARYIHQCLDEDNKKSCQAAQEYLDKYPWLEKPHEATLTNNSPVSKDEWEIQVATVKKNIRYIYDNCSKVKN